MRKGTHLLQTDFERWQLTLLYYQSLVIEVFDNVVVLILINLKNDGFDGWIAFDQYTWKELPSLSNATTKVPQRLANYPTDL